MSVPLNVFCCYDDEDLEMLELLEKHLRPLQRSGKISIWSRKNLNAGEEWKKTGRDYLENADLILLLISSSFTASDCCHIEMMRAMERHNQGSAHVIPILLRPTYCEGALFAKLHMIPTNKIAITSWSNHDEALCEVPKHISRYIIEHLKSQAAGTLPRPDTFCQVSETTYQGTKKPSPTVRMCKIIPLDAELPTQPVPSHLSLPKGYRYLGRLDGLPTEHFFREKDGHIMLLATQLAGLRPFLIDKYAITNQQFCLFINDLLERKLARISKTGRNITYCVSNDGDGLGLVWDAEESWQNTRASRTWGMRQRHGQWEPLDDCALLPATHVTWEGAQLYGRWVQNLSLDIQAGSCLPTEQQWKLAALYDTQTRKERPYPWGKEWRRDVMNSEEHWAERAIQKQAGSDRRSPPLHDHMRPVEVTAFPRGHSPLGCLQVFGNVWEWCSDKPPDHPERRIIKGGCYSSSQEHCKPSYQASRQSQQACEYIGFRCAFTYKGSN